MNWLAHLYLSEPNPQFRVGNLLPDLAARSQLISLPAPYQQGIRRHRQIDRFTDAHPRFKSCVARFPKPYRRYGGILTDVYFDHFLARDWPNYSEVLLSEFIGDVYRDVEVCLPEVPAEVAYVLRRIRDENWIASYHHIGGIEQTLRRMSRRLRRPFDLSGSRTFFEKQEAAFADDFHAFFAELKIHVQPRSAHQARRADAAQSTPSLYGPRSETTKSDPTIQSELW
jgi:acyl carrier protein phosphodiesterase